MCVFIWYFKALTMCYSLLWCLCLSKSNVLVHNAIGSFRMLLYFGILLTETSATCERTSQPVVYRRMHGVFKQLARCFHFSGHCLKENELLSFVGGPFFFMHTLSLFPVRDLWEFLHILIIFFFLIQFKIFFHLFIHSLHHKRQRKK